MILEADLLQNLGALPVEKRAITNLRVLNEAYDYAKPSSFSRGMRIDLNGLTILLISGTASIDEDGRSVHIGDFRAQQRRTYQNITGLLEAEGATWHDIVRTTCYLRDIVPKAPPGTTSCAPPATCAISNAITRRSTRSGPSSSASRNSTRCRLPPASRRSSAARNC